MLAEPPLLCYPEVMACRRAGSPVASGPKGSLSMTHAACAVLVAAALSVSVGVPAYGQTPTQTTTPTETTPTQTTTPTETAPAPESPEPTSGSNEYVESIPTGGGQTPAPREQEPAAPAPVAPTPATPAAPSGTMSGKRSTA